MIVPLPTGGARRLKPRRLSAEDIAAFRAAAGTWADVDVESLLADLYAAPDLLIAATALRYELTLVTRNLRHFQRVPGLRIYQQP
jgi:predicted nucleic acid-binding protein